MTAWRKAAAVAAVAGLAAGLALSGAAVAATSGGSTAQGATINGTKYNFGSTGWSLDPKFHKQEVAYTTTEPPGTIIISTRKRFLYYVLGNGKALRYGIGVGRYGFTWQGQEKVTRKAEWPDWHPPKEMRERDPTVPEFMKGGPGNPLGARALYLGNTEYRIHGTAQPWTIGTSVSSGCIRLTNDDVTDLYQRVKVGAKVIVQ